MKTMYSGYGKFQQCPDCKGVRDQFGVFHQPVCQECGSDREPKLIVGRFKYEQTGFWKWKTTTRSFEEKKAESSESGKVIQLGKAEAK